MIGVEISVLLSAILRALLGLYLTAHLLGKCEHFSPRCALVGVAALGALAFGWPNPAQMMLEVAAMALCAAWLLGCDGRMSLFVATFYEIALALWSFLAAAWLGVAFADAAFLDSASAQAQAALWLVHGLALVLVLIFRSRTLPRALAMKGFAAFFLASLLALISLEEQHRLAIPADATALQLMLTLILMIGVLVYNLRSQLDTERELAELRQAQAESAEREQRRIAETYEANAKLFHDLHNHLSVLRRLLAQDKSAESVAYLDSLQAPLSALTERVWTGDEIVDVLIASKAQAAEAAGIRFTAEVEFPAHSNLRGADLCAILGNLLDNALEAAAQTDARWLRLVMRRIGRTLVIKVENSAHPPQENCATTKSGDLHGWGLASARTAAARYDGVVQTSYADGVFTAVATLSFEAI